jgi:hypothetical protein
MSTPPTKATIKKQLFITIYEPMPLFMEEPRLQVVIYVPPFVNIPFTPTPTSDHLLLIPPMLNVSNVLSAKEKW